MDQARELLAIATSGDGDTRVMIADSIQQAIKTTGRLPDPRYVRKAVGDLLAELEGRDVIVQVADDLHADAAYWAGRA